MPIIVATAAPPPPPPAATHFPVTHVWVGADGSTWNLSDPSKKAYKVRGATGFGAPPVTHWWSSPNRLPGSIWQGSHDDRPDLFVPVEVWGTTSADFVAQNRAFSSSLSPTDTGTYWCYTPDGAARWSEARYSEGLESPIELDPVAQARVRYGLTLDRDDPYWKGATTTVTYSGTSIPLNTTGTRTVVNAGDVPVWPKWTLNGPWTTATVGVGSDLIVVAGSIAVGQGRIVDTDPRHDDDPAVVSLAGVDRWQDVTSRVFAPIPPGQAVSVTIGMNGRTTASSIVLEYTPAYRQAW